MKILNTHEPRSIGRFIAMLSVALVTLLGFASPAMMASASPDIVCPSGDDCFFSGVGQTGSMFEVNAASVRDTGYHNITSPDRTSDTNDSSYNLWAINVQSQETFCAPSSGQFRKENIDQAGHYYVNGDGGCDQNACPPPIDGYNPCGSAASVDSAGQVVEWKMMPEAN